MLLRDQREACHCEFLHLFAIGANRQTEAALSFARKCVFCMFEGDRETCSKEERLIHNLLQKAKGYVHWPDLYIHHLLQKLALTKATLPGFCKESKKVMTNSKCVTFEQGSITSVSFTSSCIKEVDAPQS